MTRLSLVVSAPGALGAYAAGAVAEILLALERNDRPGSVRVDVITGSSTGALAAALAARSLVVNPGLARWIRPTWLDGLRGELLLNHRRRNPAALLDAALLEDLTAPLLAAGPASDDRRSASSADPLHLGLTLTNLDGPTREVVYGPPGRRERPAGVRLHEDAAVVGLTRNHGAGHPAWEAVRRAVAAAFSLPPLLPPRSLIREPEEYPRAAWPESEEARSLRFVDGGPGRERPIALARRLAEKGGSAVEPRRVVVVDPTILEGAPRDAGESGTGGDPPGPLGRLLGALLGSGVSTEWRAATGENLRLEFLQALVDRLPDLHGRLEDPEAVGLGRTIGELAEGVAERQAARAGRTSAGGGGDPALEILNRELERIGADPRYRTALDAAPSRAGRTRIAKLIYVIESTADLRGRRPDTLYLVSPRSRGEVTGGFLGGWGGFLSRRARDHDFRAGRRDALRLLRGPFRDLVRYEPDEEEAYEPLDAPAAFDELAEGERVPVRRFVEGEVDRLLSELRLRGPGGILARLGRRSLRAALARRVMAALEESSPP